MSKDNHGKVSYKEYAVDKLAFGKEYAAAQLLFGERITSLETWNKIVVFLLGGNLVLNMYFAFRLLR